MPTYRFIDYNELTSKPDVVDMFAIYDIDADELKKFSYATLKSFFVKTDEATDIEAILEFQSTSTKPNSLLKFGSAGEFRIYSDGNDLFVKGTNAAGKLRFYANSIEMFTLNPTNSSIATQGMAINKDGTAGVGINFDSSNRPVLLSVLQCDAGIAAKLKNISNTGAVNTGLVFNSSSHGTFKQNLTVEGILYANYDADYSLEVLNKSWFKNNLRIGTNFLSNDGTNNGLYINSAGQVNCTDGMSVAGGTLSVTGGNALSAGSVFSGSDITAFSFVKLGSYLEIKENTATPTAGVGYSRIWVDGSKNVKIKFSDNTIYTFTIT